jgi:SAM-dependent methyltransferase
MAPVLEALLERAGLEPGVRVLDVGCGAGPSTVEAARRVAPGGRVIGVDISPAMIEAARRRTGDLEIDWLVADAESYPFEPGSVDVVLSRFGVMFFSDSVRAFSNLAAACREGGRLAMAVWPERDQSEFFAEPLRIVLATMDRLGVSYERPSPDVPPFSFGNTSRLRETLASAGWSQAQIEQDQRLLYVGGPGATAEEAAESFLDVGPVAGALQGQPPEVLAAARNDLREELGSRADGNGVGLRGGFLVVSARRSERGPAEDAES